MGLLSAKVRSRVSWGGWELPAQLHCEIHGLAEESPDMIQALAALFFTFNQSESEHRHGVWGYLCEGFIVMHWRELVGRHAAVLE